MTARGGNVNAQQPRNSQINRGLDNLARQNERMMQKMQDDTAAAAKSAAWNTKLAYASLALGAGGLAYSVAQGEKEE